MAGSIALRSAEVMDINIFNS